MTLLKSYWSSLFLKIGFLSLSRDLVLEVLSSNCWWYLRSCISASIFSILLSTSDKSCWFLLISLSRRISLLISLIFLSIDFIFDSIYTLISSKMSNTSFCTISRISYSCLNMLEGPKAGPVLLNLPDIYLLLLNYTPFVWIKRSNLSFFANAQKFGCIFSAKLV